MRIGPRQRPSLASENRRNQPHRVAHDGLRRSSSSDSVFGMAFQFDIQGFVPRPNASSQTSSAIRSIVARERAILNITSSARAVGSSRVKTALSIHGMCRLRVTVVDPARMLASTTDSKAASG